MKRSGPPARKKPMTGGGSSGQLRRTRIAGRSARRTVVTAERKMIREAGVQQCQVCPVLEEAGIETHCLRHRLRPGACSVEGLHERRKRSSGGSLLHEANLIPSCNWGNGFIEDEPEKVRRLTGDRLVVREGDPEWAELSVRFDRLR